MSAVKEPGESAGRGTQHDVGYRVEARTTRDKYRFPVILSDQTILGTEWREVSFSRSSNPAGIPDEPFSQKGNHDLLTHEGATALAWTLLAKLGDREVQCRLVQYKLETTWALWKSGVLAGEPMQITAEHDRKLASA